jgi:hypothetical protein
MDGTGFILLIAFLGAGFYTFRYWKNLGDK